MLRLRPYVRGEAPADRQLLRSVGAGMLLMWDRGLHSDAMIRDTRTRAAELLGRVGKALVLDPEQVLPDGTFLARIYPTPKARRHQQDGIVVRVIEYTIDDPAPRTRATPSPDHLAAC